MAFVAHSRCAKKQAWLESKIAGSGRVTGIKQRLHLDACRQCWRSQLARTDYQAD